LSGSPDGYGPPTIVSALPRTCSASENASSCIVIMQYTPITDGFSRSISASTSCRSMNVWSMCRTV
jgi:hypothetical protein